MDCPEGVLTTLEIGRSEMRLWPVVESYLARWRVEETIRFIKQSYQFEDIRLLTYERLWTMAALVIHLRISRLLGTRQILR